MHYNKHALAHRIDVEVSDYLRDISLWSSDWLLSE
jgi:hypothetical protein